MTSEYEKYEAEIWEKFYPQAKGTVLDVGSHCDSPFWFLRHGASSVVAIDKENFAKELEHPQIRFVQAEIDAIKIDIEGAERNMIIETHFENPRLQLLHEFWNGVKLFRLEGGKSLL
jgi:hypothetical protein